MGDQYRCDTTTYALDRAKDSRFVFGIKAIGGLVEHQKPWLAQERTGKRKTLALSLRQRRSAVTYDGIEALRQPRNKLVSCRPHERVAQLAFAGVGPCPQEVGAHSVVKQEGILSYVADSLAPPKRQW